VEELRPVIADRLALTLINRRQVAADGFRANRDGRRVMSDTTRKEVLVAYQKRKQEEMVQPVLAGEDSVRHGALRPGDFACAAPAGAIWNRTPSFLWK